MSENMIHRCRRVKYRLQRQESGQGNAGAKGGHQTNVKQPLRQRLPFFRHTNILPTRWSNCVCTPRPLNPSPARSVPFLERLQPL